MMSMIGSGAHVDRAVRRPAAGWRATAAARTSAAPCGRCAVLGFAIGKVSDAEVRRYRTQHATPRPPSQPLPPTQFPAQQAPGGVPPTQRPGVPVPSGQPTAAGPPPTAQPFYGQPGSGGARRPPSHVPPALVLATGSAAPQAQDLADPGRHRGRARDHRRRQRSP